MNIQRLLIATALFGSAAFAGKKPLKVELCAQLNRSENLCIVKSADGKRTYLEQSTFAQRDTVPTYTLAQTDKTKTTLGNASRTITATMVFWDSEKKEATERDFQIDLSRVVVPGAEWKGIIKIEGRDPSLREIEFTEPK